MKPFFFVLAIFISWNLSAQNVDYDKVADRIVNQSLEVKPGEVVAIHGDTYQTDLLEALYVAVYKAGGQVLLRMRIPDAEVRVAKEVDREYLKQPEWAGAVISRLADCVISVSSVDDPARWRDVDPDAIKAWREGADKTRMVGAHDRQRFVSVGQTDGIPTKAVADLYGADYNTIQSDFWQAMSADHATLQKTGSDVIAQLKPGATCKVTSPYGTDISFRLGNNTAQMSCGKTTDQHSTLGNNYAWLPAGDAFTTVDPTSANGKLVMPAYYWNNEKYTNFKIEFKNGLIHKISADQNTDRIETLVLGRGADAVPLSALNIGVNPYSKVRGDYRSYQMAGMVTLCIGDNDWAGGSINNGLDYGFHISQASLTVENNSVVDSGELNKRVLSQ